tara:strand:- start:1259 stop:1888 length:630 start_codon:yes stop_codon:yes gene_type:complete
MLLNKYKFNQSSVELEISGLPDYSNNDNKENISIISNWKLSIINQPEIEGGIDHLRSVVKAFYKCTASILLNINEKIESDLIDINWDYDGNYNITLKSTKPNIKPLNLQLGYAEFSDIINCFDQFKNSTKIKFDFDDLLPEFKKKNTMFSDKHKLFTNFFPPIIAFLSLSIFTLISFYFYNRVNRERNISSISEYIHSMNVKSVIKIKK